MNIFFYFLEKVLGPGLQGSHIATPMSLIYADT